MQGQKITAEEALKSNNQQIIAKYIIAHPNDPLASRLKIKLIHLIKSNAKSQPQPKPSVVESTPSEKEASVPRNPYIDKLFSRKMTKRERILDHLFNSNPQSKEALLSLKNKSKCPLIVKASGKGSHTTKVAAGDTGYLLLPKGSYTLHTAYCGKKFTSKRKLYRDIEITFR